MQTDTIIQAGGLSQLCHLLAHPRPNIVKEAAWAVSNITAGNVNQIQEVVNAGIMAPLMHVLQNVSYTLCVFINLLKILFHFNGGRSYSFYIYSFVLL